MESPKVQPVELDSSSNQSTSVDDSLGPSDGPISPICALDHRVLPELSKAARPWNWGPPFRIASSVAVALFWGPSLIGADGTEQLARVAWDVLPYIVLNIVAELICREVVRRGWPEHPDPWSLADCFCSVAQYAAFVYLCCHALLSTPQTVEGRFTHENELGYMFLRAYTSKTLVHIPLLWLTDVRPTQRLMMLGHHALSIVAYSTSLFSGRCLYYACLAGMCEVSTFHLTVMWIMKETKTDKYFKNAFVVNGACLWLAFVVCRLMLFPFWLYQFFSDLAVPETRELTYTQGNWVELVFDPFTIVFLLVISSKWFTAIHKGMIKALQGKDDFKTKDA